MAHCTTPAIIMMVIGALVLILGQIPGMFIAGKSAKHMVQNLDQMHPKGGPRKEFTIDSSACEGINMFSGIGIVYDYRNVKAKCEDITVKVTFTPQGEPDSVRHPVKFYDNCSNTEAMEHAYRPEKGNQKFLAEYGEAGGARRLEDVHWDKEDSPDDAPVDGGSGIRQKGTFFFQTRKTAEDACKDAQEDDPLCQKAGQSACVQGTYHIESSEPVMWFDMNKMMMAGLGGLIGMMAGLTGVLLSCCCGWICCGVGGVIACVAQSPPPPQPLLEGLEQPAGYLVPGQDNQMRTFSAA